MERDIWRKTDIGFYSGIKPTKKSSVTRGTDDFLCASANLVLMLCQEIVDTVGRVQQVADGTIMV